LSLASHLDCRAAEGEDNENDNCDPAVHDFRRPRARVHICDVSNADDGEIRTYTLQADGSLKPGQTAKAEKIVMPMVVTPDKRFLIAAVRSKPYQAYSYVIDQKTGDLNLVGTGPLAESFPYISLDRGGRFLFGASYGANLVSVNPVGADGSFD
jgi:6-phosphogluconolactonase